MRGLRLAHGDSCSRAAVTYDLDAATLQGALQRVDRSRLPADRVAQITRAYKPGVGIDMVNGVDMYREITR